MDRQLPKGWISVDFDDCFIVPKGPFVKLQQKQYLEEGKYPIIDQGAKFVAGYTDDKDNLFHGDLPVVIFGDHTRIVKYVDFPFCIGADGTKILQVKEGVNPKYAYYYLKSIEIPSKGYSRHYRYLREIKVLIPPPNEQERLVAKLEELFKQVDNIWDSLESARRQFTVLPRSILHKAFSGELVSQDPNDEPASVLLESIKKK